MKDMVTPDIMRFVMDNEKLKDSSVFLIKYHSNMSKASFKVIFRIVLVLFL